MSDMENDVVVKQEEGEGETSPAGEAATTTTEAEAAPAEEAPAPAAEVAAEGSTEAGPEEDEPMETESAPTTAETPAADTVTQKEEEEAEEEEEPAAAEQSEDYAKLTGQGLDGKVATEIEIIYQEGIMTSGELDDRAVDALKEFPVEGACTVLKQFRETNLEHVTNKSAYLCGMLKTFRTRNRMKGDQISQAKGPDEAKLKEILSRTGYTLDVTTGQRKYGGPPPDAEGPPPGTGCEVFCGKIPKDMFEDELVPVFEPCGKIWDLRLMMDPLTGQNRGYAFITFCDKEGAAEAVKRIDGHEIRKGKKIKVNISVANQRIFVGNIPKNRDRAEISAEFCQHTSGLVEVIIYSSPDDKKKNRGFCFLEYESHKAASLAKRRLSTGRIRPWNCDIIVDWADPIEEPDEATMSQVGGGRGGRWRSRPFGINVGFQGALNVNPVNLDREVTEEKMKEYFEPFARLRRSQEDQGTTGFVHFDGGGDDCVKAMEEMNGKELEGATLEISLAKPPTDKKKKEQRMREQERRLMMMRG
ncbi:PREDICTED: LOW QUALITY PROTEIN: heterogeneous nuclear ribonucleoprotein R-like [Priapulus caudatus]|uniref:LOW QUALITY PROTEIN: heterogeneous nuclear ribonucleoprotein R-like n=1 Tax=Priapulus caudatus TaxID=37621 RepID=A0ABM1EZ00_PRICU|nr:PREDICTED: LOW QUALITY PROTEIN: heterogeneous nuclear ribonucleoprotein R-like [Priapulus caudatus]